MPTGEWKLKHCGDKKNQVARTDNIFLMNNANLFKIGFISFCSSYMFGNNTRPDLEWTNSTHAIEILSTELHFK